jgi:hypothetical protein
MEIQATHNQLNKMQSEGFKGTAIVKPIEVDCRLSSWVIIWNFFMDYYKPSKKIYLEEHNYIYRYFPYEIYSLEPKTRRIKQPNQNAGLKDFLKLDFNIDYDYEIIY